MHRPLIRIGYTSGKKKKKMFFLFWLLTISFDINCINHTLCPFTNFLLKLAGLRQPNLDTGFIWIKSFLLCEYHGWCHHAVITSGSSSFQVKSCRFVLLRMSMMHKYYAYQSSYHSDQALFIRNLIFCNTLLFALLIPKQNVVLNPLSCL